jgi:tRNA(Ile)-lysidine synthase
MPELTAYLQKLKSARYIYIAYSGGIDSHVLLHLCATHPELKAKITAVYVHHGLQPKAESWAMHCQQQAAQVEVKFQLLRVNAFPKNGQSPEEAARDARYQALEKLIHENDVLLVAQHQEDQLETVLLQLFRGAGVQGLAAMPKEIGFSQGKMLRPFLDVSKQSIQEYAQTHHLTWVEDPTNQCDDFDRNFLRNQIVPLLKTRWTNVAKTVSRSANHCANAQQLLNELAENLFAQVMTASPLKDWQSCTSTLSISKLLQLDSNQQQLVIRQWFKQQNLQMPSTDFIDNIFKTVIAAKPSAEPQLKKSGIVIRRYQDNLYCSKDLPDFKNLTGLVWEQSENQILLPDNSILQRYPAHSGIPASLWKAANVTIKFRQGGEKISLAGRKGQHTLKNLFQENAIPPWERDLIPLLYFDNVLIAVADLWLSSQVQIEQQELCYKLKWQKLS